MPLHPNDSPGFLLWHATLRWQRGITAALAPLDLTHVQFVLLACTWWLNTHGEHPNQLAVARHPGQVMNFHFTPLGAQSWAM